MVFDYFSFARAKKNQEALEKTNPQNPVLKHEDEQFLERVTSEHATPAAPLPPTVIGDDGIEHLAESSELEQAAEAASEVALPASTNAEDVNLTHAASDLSANDAQTQKRTWASYVPSMPSIPTWKSKATGKAGDEAAQKDKVDGNGNPPAEEQAVKTEPSHARQEDTLSSDTQPDTELKVDEKVDAPYPPGVKVTEEVKLDEEKQAQDVREVSVILDRLNLSSINNRVFSFSTQSQKLYEDFTIVLKDMINGAPTAYQDMDKLLKENESHLSEMFNNMPPFVQTLVKSLPAKLGSSLGPEILAAASEKPGADMRARMAAASKPQPGTGSAAAKSNKKRGNVPSVKGLANEKGAIAGMLRSIVTFLQTRFPAFVTGTNVIMSLAVFILLFVFYYCHKRGRETRLSREKDAASAAASVEGSDAESGLEESTVLTPEDGEQTATEGGDVDEERDESMKATHAVLNQPEPSAVPLPPKDDVHELEGEKVESSRAQS